MTSECVVRACGGGEEPIARKARSGFSASFSASLRRTSRGVQRVYILVPIDLAIARSCRNARAAYGCWCTACFVLWIVVRFCLVLFFCHLEDHLGRRNGRHVSLVSHCMMSPKINRVMNRRSTGEQVLELGCNAVLAYQQDFDVEGDSGIVARAYGTACVIQQRELPPSSFDAAKTNEHTLTRQVFIFIGAILHVSPVEEGCTCVAGLEEGTAYPYPYPYP